MKEADIDFTTELFKDIESMRVENIEEILGEDIHINIQRKMVLNILKRPFGKGCKLCKA